MKDSKNLRCGLIGEHLGHSYSPLIHASVADYSYELCELAPDELESFVRSQRLDAYNVTIPYKKSVIPYLDSLSEEAREIGAVNAVVRGKDGRLCGHNTDYFGFDYMLTHSGIDVAGKRTLVLGSGGASLPVCAVLKKRGAATVKVISHAENNPEGLSPYYDAHVIVNTTPVGMYPNNYVSPVDLSAFPLCEGVLDIIFNPQRTSLMLDAKERGIKCAGGLSMLVAQAVRAAELFDGVARDDAIIDEIEAKISHMTKNLILVGMPACGKSTVGKIIADKLSREFVDADEEFERMHGISPAECISTRGEESFRELENDVLRELGKRSSAVIATGGGAVTREYNYRPLHQNGTILFLERDLSKLTSRGRPLSKSCDLGEMYAQREPMYRRFADATVRSYEDANDTAERMISEFLKIK